MATAVAGTGQNSSAISGARFGVRSKPLLYETRRLYAGLSSAATERRCGQRSEGGKSIFHPLLRLTKDAGARGRDPAGRKGICISHFAFASCLLTTIHPIIASV